MKRVAISAITGVIAVAILGACGGVSPVPNAGLTVHTAKAKVLAEERRLVSAMPAKFIAQHRQATQAHLISCTSGGYTWPDKGRVELKGNPDIHGLLQDIANLYEGDPRFSVAWGKTLDGAEKLTITAQSGASYLVASRYNDSELQIASFSDCFELAPDEWSGDAY